jgi:hypothetical protein
MPSSTDLENLVFVQSQLSGVGIKLLDYLIISQSGDCFSAAEFGALDRKSAYALKEWVLGLNAPRKPSVRARLHWLYLFAKVNWSLLREMVGR